MAGGATRVGPAGVQLGPYQSSLAPLRSSPQALAKRATLPALKDIEPGIVGAIELLYTRHEDAKSLWLECPRSVPLDLGPYANAHESAVEYVYAFRGGSCVQEPYVHAFRDGKMVRLPLPEAPTSEQTQDPGADKEANRYM